MRPERGNRGVAIQVTRLGRQEIDKNSHMKYRRTKIASSDLKLLYGHKRLASHIAITTLINLVIQ